MPSFEPTKRKPMNDTKETKDMKPLGIGEIRNYYGGLYIMAKDGSYYWSIEDYNGSEWQEIPYYLFEALCKFEKIKKPNQ